MSRQLRTHQLAYRRHEAESLLLSIAKRAKEIEEAEKEGAPLDALSYGKSLQRRDVELLEQVQQRMRRLSS
jgi:hypothetical protein